ncbi:hypothetical protein KUCAC02_002298 [Chaenocephalus aceratus]|uniref:Uncharacterized protein n=1 Tax=Chaenocephalus aceratus TaxID=36190 RepID=A0ACB9XV52_CHAAC|nr:hypothetical protein KUCAC02_002298 [Chaenocephalus aceratus]
MPGVGTLTGACSLDLDIARPLFFDPALAPIQSSPPSSLDIPLPSAQLSSLDYIPREVVGPPRRFLDPGLRTDDNLLDLVPKSLWTASLGRLRRYHLPHLFPLIRTWWRQPRSSLY